MEALGRKSAGDVCLEEEEQTKDTRLWIWRGAGGDRVTSDRVPKVLSIALVDGG